MEIKFRLNGKPVQTEVSEDSVLLNVLRQLGLLLPFMWILSKIMGMDGIWYAFIAAEVITAAISWILYRKYPVKL